MSSTAADWDMTAYFAGVDADGHRAFGAALDADIEQLARALREAPPLARASVARWTGLLVALEAVGARAGHLTSYYGCLGAADATDEAVRAATAAHAARVARADILVAGAREALGRAPDDAFAALLSAPALAGAGFHLERLRDEARYAMDEPRESLAADLGVTGFSAWSRLYDRIAGTLELELALPGRAPTRHPVSQARTLMEDADPAVRRAAFAGSARAWSGVGETVAACLNAIAGTRLLLYARRGIDDVLAPALRDAALERATLETMLDVVRARQPLARQFLRLKARLLGVERLGVCDIMAPPPGEDDGRIAWDDGLARVRAVFARAYPALAALAGQAVAERWIDHSPRPGKRPGAFCSTSPVLRTSRVFLTYAGAMGDVQTLAHELGHAFHGSVLRDLRPWAARYPMTLAETASTFAENLLTHAALADPATSDALRLRLLDQRLQDAEAFLLNIPMRFDFETALYARRAQGELGVAELQALMLAAQQQTYGDALDPAQLDPWFWASKQHFYFTTISFYNFPYTFGYLFSAGLFARFLEQGEAFLPRYEALLRRTGSASAETLAREALGVDLREPGFWHASIDLVERDLERFAALVERG